MPSCPGVSPRWCAVVRDLLGNASLPSWAIVTVIGVSALVSGGVRIYLRLIDLRKHAITEEHATLRWRMATHAMTPSPMSDVVHELETGDRVLDVDKVAEVDRLRQALEARAEPPPEPEHQPERRHRQT
jgi:hypothetical protein